MAQDPSLRQQRGSGEAELDGCDVDGVECVDPWRPGREIMQARTPCLPAAALPWQACTFLQN